MPARRAPTGVRDPRVCEPWGDPLSPAPTGGVLGAPGYAKVSLLQPKGGLGWRVLVLPCS